MVLSMAINMPLFYPKAVKYKHGKNTPGRANDGKKSG